MYLEGGAALALGLQLFDLEWQNIRAGWSCVETLRGADERAARLCVSYSRVGAALLNMRLHPRERIRWLEVGLDCTRRLGDRKAEGRHLGDLGMAYAALGEDRLMIGAAEAAFASLLADPLAAAHPVVE